VRCSEIALAHFKRKSTHDHKRAPSREYIKTPLGIGGVSRD
jgi:hypothetical protein